MNIYLKRIAIFLIALFFLTETNTLFSQNSNTDFDNIYNSTLKLFDKTRDISLQNIDTINNNSLSDIQKAKINFIKTRIALLYEVDPLLKNNPVISGKIQDTLSGEGKMLFRAQQYTNQSIPDKAIPLLLKILDNVNVDSDIALKSKIYMTEAYREKREYHKGIFILREVLQNKNVSPENRAFAYNRMAAVFDEMGDPHIATQDTVIKYSEYCIKISEENFFPDYLAASQNEIGFIYWQQKKYSKAIKYCTDAVENFIKIKKFSNAMNASINLCNVYLALHKNEQADSVINYALGLSDVNKNKNLFMRLYLKKSDIYSRMNNFKKAYHFLELARIMQNDFYHDRMEFQINDMSAKYELRLKESKIKEEEQKNKIQQHQKIFLFIFLFVLTVVFIFVSINFRLKRKIRIQTEKIVKQENSELKTSLEFKEKELRYKTKELSQAIANIISFNETLRNIKKSLDKATNKETVQIINNNLISNHSWDKFKLTFNNVYPSFFTKINEKFPNLTENETKLCAFLVMDLKTREIADIMNISEASVSKNRNRLRKKLQLETGTNIAEFLKNI